MSKEQQIQINFYLSIAAKVGFGIATWFAVSMINEIKDELKSNGKDLKEIGEKIIHLEDKANSHDDDIRRIKDFLTTKL